MNRKTIIGIIVVIGVLSLGAVALAHGPGYGRGGYMNGPGYSRGYGHGYGPGHMWNYGDNQAYSEETARTLSDLSQKRAELEATLSAPEVDEAKAKELVGEINKLENELNQQRLAARFGTEKE